MLTPAGGVFYDPVESSLITKVAPGFLRFNPFMLFNFPCLLFEFLLQAVPAPIGGVILKPVFDRFIQTDIMADLFRKVIFVNLNRLQFGGRKLLFVKQA